MLVFLIGMPGSGKTTLGLQLANRLQTVFLDLDLAIEAEMGMTIREVFRTEGEDFFRKKEREVLLKSIEKEDGVIAAGGGTPCFFDNMEQMNKAGLTIFLDVSSEELIRRLDKEVAKRPLFFGQNITEKIEKLYEGRKGFYEGARLKISSEHLSPEDLLDMIGSYNSENQK